MSPATLSADTQARWNTAIAAANPRRHGTISSVSATTFQVVGMTAAVGEHVVVDVDGAELHGSVISLTSNAAIVAAYGSVSGLKVGMVCVPSQRPMQVPVGKELLGRVINSIGAPIDGKGPIAAPTTGISGTSPNPMTRQMVEQPFRTGVRAIDATTPLAKGQRIGVFAGSGVGKSTLLSMMVRGADADVIVVGLVGERGREVREFIENNLGEQGMAKSVVVVATGDEAPLLRRTAAETATRIAEDFRDRGNDVLLVLDSVTRFALAQREIGLAAGELPAARGFTPSTLSELPRLLERAGNSEHGTMTAIYTVLVDGDDHDDPVADAVRGILDGHIVLTRDLANAAHFPAIDVLASVSRLSSVVHTPEQAQLVSALRKSMADVAAARDLIDVGAYVPGSNAAIDTALARQPHVEAFLKQDQNHISPTVDTWVQLAEAMGGHS